MNKLLSSAALALASLLVPIASSAEPATWPVDQLTDARIIQAAKNIVQQSKFLTEPEANFLSYADIYCRNITQTGGVGNFRRKMLPEMRKSAEGSDAVFNRYWTAPYCEPRRIGGTASPLAHLVVENPTDRLVYLVALQKTYAEVNDQTTFTRIVNARNSREQTTLDYLNYLYLRNDFSKSEEKPLNDLYRFLCDNGGQFNAYAKTCSGEPFRIDK